MSKNKYQKKNRKVKSKRNHFSVGGALRFIKVSVVMTSLASMLAFSIYYGSEAVDQMMERPITEIKIESEFHFLSSEESRELISKNIKGHFLTEDLLGMREKLLQNPWIDDVILSRRWPDSLVIKITEQVPVARWNESAFINNRGEVIFIASPSKTLSDGQKQLRYLPHLRGEDKQAFEMLNEFYRLTEIVKGSQLMIAELEKDVRGNWSATMNNGWQVMIGRDHLEEKLKRFNRVVNQQLKPVAYNISVIDLRYEHGLAVRWKEPVENILPVAFGQSHGATISNEG